MTERGTKRSGLWFNFSAKGGSLVSEDGGRTWRRVTEADIARSLREACAAADRREPERKP